MIDDNIDKILVSFNKENMAMFNTLILELKKCTEGSDLVGSNPYFKGYEIALMNKKVSQVSLKTVI